MVSCLDDGTRPADGDPESGGRALNSTCRGGVQPLPDQEFRGLPLDFEASFFAHPLPILGFGARVWLQALSDSIGTHESIPDTGAPALQLAIGPRFRLYLRNAKTSQIRIDPGLALGYRRLSPWAGQAQYHQDQGFLDAGSWGLFTVGVSLGMEARLQASRGSVFTFALQAGLYPWSQADLEPEREGEGVYRWDEATQTGVTEEVAIIPPALAQQRLTARRRLGGLIPATVDNAALGPFFELNFDRAMLMFEDDPDTYWCGSTCDTDPTHCSSCNEDVRKVYSTEVMHISAVLGIQVVLGTGGRD